MGDAPRSKRLFAGIELDERTRAACAAASATLQKAGFVAKYESPEKLHVTLAFLGNVEATRVTRIAAALQRAAAQSPRFSIELDKLGAFPHERKPHVIYVGSRNQGERYRSLSANLRKELAELGFAFTDDAVAHVTIARVKESKRPLPLVELQPISLRLKQVSLFESIFDKTRNTSRYDIIETVKMSG
jgi:RNA 2',3'-cyclic 3'-phosphodiesterase